MKSVKNMRKQIIDFADSVVTPKDKGCVRGGANWEEVHQMIENIFYDCNVELWRLDKG